MLCVWRCKHCALCLGVLYIVFGVYGCGVRCVVSACVNVVSWLLLCVFLSVKLSSLIQFVINKFTRRFVDTRTRMAYYAHIRSSYQQYVFMLCVCVFVCMYVSVWFCI